MTGTRNAIKDAIEQEVGNGDWNGIGVEDGRYEGSLQTIDIDPDTIEAEEIDLDAGTITVTASGPGSAVYKDADGVDKSEEFDNVKVTAKVSITLGGASIKDVVNDD